jgi:iron complex outermembrane receptor protein
MMGKKTSILLTGLAAAAIGPVIATPVMAAGAAAGNDTDELTEIIVTARRTEENLQDVPISITVFNQQQLANSNIVNSEDLARITPSLSVNNNFGPDGATYAIRGFIQENGTAPSVGVYFADVVAPRAASNGTPAGDGAGAGSYFDLQNVQVLKGPQGTLFGRNTTGGAVLLVPAKPTSELGGYVEGSYGNFDMRRVQSVVNLPIGTNVRLRLGVDSQARDGYLNNKGGIGPSELGNVDYTAFRGSLVVDVTENLENYTIGSVLHSRNYGDVQKAVAGPGTPGLGTIYAGPVAAQVAQTPGYYDVFQAQSQPLSRQDNWQGINTTTWKATDNLTVKNIVSYAHLKLDTATSLFGLAPSVPVNGVNYIQPFTESHSIPGSDSAHESTFTEELQFQGNAFNNRLTWQGGGYGESVRPVDGDVGSKSGFLASCTNSAANLCTDVLGDRLAGILGLPPQFVQVGAINYTAGQTYFRDLGVYGQATYKITDQFKLTGGYRYTWDHESTVSFQTTSALLDPPNYGISPPVLGPNPRCTQPLTTADGCVNRLYQQSSAPTWLIDLDYTPTDDLLVYAKYSRGYRAGGIAPNVTAPLNVFQAERVNTYEAGFKSTFNAPLHATFDTSVFYNDFTNQQIQLGFNAIPQSGFSSTAAPANAGASRIYGLELNSSVVPFHGLVVNVGYTWLDTRITQTSDLSSVNLTGFTLSAPFHKGDAIVLTPRNKAVVDTSYTLPLASNVGKVSVGGTFSYTGRQLANYSERTVPGFEQYSDLPSTGLLDLNASWVDILGTPLDASLFATNVTGKEYFTYVPGLASAGFGFETYTLGQPRMYGLRVRYHFGQI